MTKELIQSKTDELVELDKRHFIHPTSDPKKVPNMAQILFLLKAMVFMRKV